MAPEAPTQLKLKTPIPEASVTWPEIVKDPADAPTSTLEVDKLNDTATGPLVSPVAWAGGAMGVRNVARIATSTLAITLIKTASPLGRCCGNATCFIR
jgi:hypothetical protein